MENSIAFKEVYDILNVLGSDYINKIPSKMYNFICENKEEDYITNIHNNTNFENENISKEALEIITYINLQYWCDENQKRELLSKFNEKAIERQKEYTKMFSQKNIEEKISNNSIMDLTTIHQKKLMYRIMKFIKSIFVRKK